MAFVTYDMLIVDEYNELIKPYNGLKMAYDGGCL